MSRKEFLICCGVNTQSHDENTVAILIKKN